MGMAMRVVRKLRSGIGLRYEEEKEWMEGAMMLTKSIWWTST